MEAISRSTNRSGMTLLEVILVLLVVAAVLLWNLLPALQGSRPGKASGCLNNHKQLLYALAMFTEDHENRFPPQVATVEGGSREFISLQSTYPHFLGLASYLGTDARVLVCPASAKKGATNFAALNDSHLTYFINLDADPKQTNYILIGDEFISSDAPTGQKLIVTKKTTLRWAGSHSKNSRVAYGNLGFSDCHVARTVLNTNLQDLWLKSGQEQARFSLPRK